MGTPPEPAQLERELEVELLTELTLARAEREGQAVRARQKRWSRVRFLVVVLVLTGIAAVLIELSLRALRASFGA
jgi:hypothetical protein